MRLDPIAWMTSRRANRDDIVPLAFPITTKSGERITSIPIKKGTPIDISLAAYNQWIWIELVLCAVAEQKQPSGCMGRRCKWVEPREILRSKEGKRIQGKGSFFQHWGLQQRVSMCSSLLHLTEVFLQDQLLYAFKFGTLYMRLSATGTRACIAWQFA